MSRLSLKEEICIHGLGVDLLILLHFMVQSLYTKIEDISLFVPPLAFQKFGLGHKIFYFFRSTFKEVNLSRKKVVFQLDIQPSLRLGKKNLQIKSSPCSCVYKIYELLMVKVNLKDLFDEFYSLEICLHAGPFLKRFLSGLPTDHLISFIIVVNS